MPLIEPVGTHHDAKTLIPLIQKYILPGFIIVSDCWRAYITIKDLGYQHLQINHSENFVDPDNVSIHTQNIECFWRDLKEWIKRPGNKSIYFKQYIARYLFIQHYPETELLHHFFLEAAKQLGTNQFSDRLG